MDAAMSFAASSLIPGFSLHFSILATFGLIPGLKEE